MPRLQQAVCDDDTGEDGGGADVMLRAEAGADGSGAYRNQLHCETPAPSACDSPSGSDEELLEMRADLFYIAADLRALAAQAPAHKAIEILALSDLVASLAAKPR